MKKYGSLIALAVVIILAVVAVTTKKEPVQKITAPYSIAKVEGLERIELTQPGDTGGLVVLTFGENGWTLTKPVEAPVAERLSEQVAGAFANKINTDPVKLDATKLEEFGLGDDGATKIALFAKGSETPASEFFIGKTFTVDGTRAKRTYVKTTDGKVFRAQTEIGDILGKPVAELRSKTIQTLDRTVVSELWVKYQDATKNLHLKKGDKEWKLEAPVVDYELDRSTTSGMVNGVSNLIATGFVDDKSAADVGLDPWYARVIARETGGDPVGVLLSEIKDGKAYAMRENGKHIFEIAENTAKQLMTSALDLRSRLVKDLKADAIARVDFGGDARISVQQDENGWSFVRGAKGTVKVSALNPKVGAVAQLRAVRFETPDIATTGLQKPSEKVTITMKDGSKHTLLVGGEADQKGNLWAKWQDVNLIMVVPQWIKERSAPTAAELTEETS